MYQVSQTVNGKVSYFEFNSVDAAKAHLTDVVQLDGFRKACYYGEGIFVEALLTWEGVAFYPVK